RPAQQPVSKLLSIKNDQNEEEIHSRGEATTFISRKQALKRLQLSLKRLPPAGVYPQEARHASRQQRRVNKGSSTPKVYYHLKDIQFLGHERVMQKLRDIKAHLKKAKRAKERGEMHTVDRLQRNFPAYTPGPHHPGALPAFEDAVRDLDDCLCLCFLFSRLPKERGVPVEQIRLSARLTVQFLHWVIAARALRKRTSTSACPWCGRCRTSWACTTRPMWTSKFCALSTIFTPPCWVWDWLTRLRWLTRWTPPTTARRRGHEEFMASLNQPLLSRRGGEAEGNPAEPDDFPDEEAEGAEAASAARRKARAQQRLFNGCRFFLNRETPRQILCFVSWSPLSGPGSRYPESDQRVTHQIVDRPLGDSRLSGRAYVQPQWVFDDCTSRPAAAAAASPQPVSPRYYSLTMPTEGDEGRPAALLGHSVGAARPRGAPGDRPLPLNWRRRTIMKLRMLRSGKLPLPMQLRSGSSRKSREKAGTQRRTQDAKQAAAEERRLREMMLPKKHKQLYKKMVFSRKRQARESAQLAEKKQKRQRTA
uniref:BRCT domain-containing protein n=1 Tax=Macrostomum lignano TaxID=282301 RepID=A0A1I8FEU3_9PLAT